MYQMVLHFALLRLNFSLGTCIYMLPSDLELNIGKLQEATIKC